MSMNIASITAMAINMLHVDEAANVRKIGRGADKDFIASIKAHGIRMPLIVRANGEGFAVIDGGKRLEAAQALVKSGDLPADTTIPVIDATGLPDAEALELSLTLNLIRADMHPVDAYRAFIALHTDKERPLDVDAISTRFGVSARTVKQRLALGAVHDDILNAYRDGTIKQDVVQAFTLCADKKEQARVFAKFSKTGHVQQWEVKRELNLDGRKGRFINLVGAEAYEARGGKATVDLFGEDHQVSNIELLGQMVDEKVEAMCQELVAQGWKWAMLRPADSYQYGRLDVKPKPTPAEQKKLKELEAQANDDNLDPDDCDTASQAHDDLLGEIRTRSYGPKQKATAGCFLSLNYRDGTIQIEYGFVQPERKQAEKANAASSTTASFDSGQLGRVNPPKKVKPKGPAALTQAMTDRLNSWRRVALVKALAAHPYKDGPLAKLMAGLIASQIHPDSRNSWAPDPIQKKADELIELLDPKVMNAEIRKAFDASDYFEGCGKAFCLAAITEAVNADEARKVSGQKRGQIAKFALTNVGKTKWLPKELRTKHYDGPAAKAAAKPKAKATAKKR